MRDVGRQGSGIKRPSNVSCYGVRCMTVVGCRVADACCSNGKEKGRQRAPARGARRETGMAAREKWEGEEQGHEGGRDMLRGRRGDGLTWGDGRRCWLR
eukprot:3878125-Rhodomonas_salina.1